MLLILLFLGLVALTVQVIRRLFLVLQGVRRGAMVGRLRGVRTDALEGIGISVLVADPAGVDEVARLLAVEYARYEVVVTLDSETDAGLFAQLVSRYRMIGVAWTPTGELATAGVRGVMRSRRRVFRRFVLVDCKRTDPSPQPLLRRLLAGRSVHHPAAAQNAAAAVASETWLLPLEPGRRLLPGVIERLVVALGESLPGEMACLESKVGPGGFLVAREELIRLGGFAACRPRCFASARRRPLWEPLFEGAEPMSCRLVILVEMLFVSGTFALALAGWWPLAGILATAALLWLAKGCVSRMLAASSDGERRVEEFVG